MTEMPDEYNDTRCNDCGEDLFQLGGDWLCPECDGGEAFTLDEDRDAFRV